MNGVKKGILSITFWVLYLCQANVGSRETGQILLLKGFFTFYVCVDSFLFYL